MLLVPSSVSRWQRGNCVQCCERQAFRAGSNWLVCRIVFKPFPLDIPSLGRRFAAALLVTGVFEAAAATEFYDLQIGRERFQL